MNRYQERLVPGSPEAKRSYCTCSGATETTTTPSGDMQTRHVINPNCKLHSPTPENTLTLF